MSTTLLVFFVRIIRIIVDWLDRRRKLYPEVRAGSSRRKNKRSKGRMGEWAIAWGFRLLMVWSRESHAWAMAMQWLEADLASQSHCSLLASWLGQCPRVLFFLGGIITSFFCF